MMMTYEEVIYQIENAHRFGNLPGVEVTEHVLKQLNQINGKLPFVHVAGTNGKGSVCAFITQALKDNGLKVGTFISPHVVVFEERIAINGQMISREDVTRIGSILLDTDFGVTLTMFDYCLAMALIYFAEQNCDIAVIETGLGGKLDSTNAIGVPIATVITKIGYDHVAILGDNLEDIAREKAGIIKNGSRLFVETQETEAEKIIKETAGECGVEAVFVTKQQIEEMSKLKLRLLGVHQWENAAVAKLASEHVLAKLGVNYDEEKIKKSLQETLWPGRMEVISNEPFMMLDACINPASCAHVIEVIGHLGLDRIVCIIGIPSDKDYAGVVRKMHAISDKIILTQSQNPHYMFSQEQCDTMAREGIETVWKASVPDAISYAKTTNLPIVILGTTSVVSEVKQYQGGNECACI